VKEPRESFFSFKINDFRHAFERISVLNKLLIYPQQNYDSIFTIV